jgi:hypothetical protein
MKVLRRDDKEVYEVFDIVYTDEGEPKFLVYMNKSWELVSAWRFTPNFYEDYYGNYVELD